MTLSAGYSLSQTKTQVAKVLMEKSGDASAQRQQLAQRDIASLLGVGWEMVHASLESLENDGVIRVERHVRFRHLDQVLARDRIAGADR